MGVKSLVKKVLPKHLIEFLIRKINYFKYHSLIQNTYKHYAEVENKIKSKKERLNVAAYVIFDSTFCAYDLFDLMMADLNNYNPKIVIIPDVSRGENHMKRQYNESRNFFVKKYGSEYILDGWIEDTNSFEDYSSIFDIIYLANPYDHMVNDVHSISFLSKKDVLPIYISYGCMPDFYGCKMIMPMKEISLFWKVFADNEMSYKDYCKYELVKGKNVVLSGYAKMDALEKFIERPRQKKTVIIAPHHTINNSALPLSNFVKYQDFYLELPKIFPQVDFIFRPHPLLFTNMVNLGYWTDNDVSNYLKKIESCGMKYSVGGDYFDIFVNSDAMIHDCSSFVVEYLYTGKPCCFMAKQNYKKIFSTLGKECLKNYYLAFNEKQIIDFIKNVVIDGDDSLASERKEFTEKNLAINYPNVSKVILNEISIFNF